MVRVDFLLLAGCPCSLRSATVVADRLQAEVELIGGEGIRVAAADCGQEGMDEW